MNDFAKQTLLIAKNIQEEIPRKNLPPDEGLPSESQQVIPFSVVRGSRGYIEKVVHQINGCYENGWFDGCAVMIRRLIETLIIEVYEYHSISEKIKNDNDDFLYLNDLVGKILTESAWNLGRNVKRALPKLKDIGDRSAHSRRYIAHRQDIDKNISELREVVQELIYLANLK
jgi:hypothetical protein